MRDNDSSFARAALPGPVRVLGIALQPCCIGHVLILQRLDHPLASGESCGHGDAAVAAWCATRPWADAWRGIGRWHMRAFSLLFALRLWRAGRRLRSQDLALAQISDGLHRWLLDPQLRPACMRPADPDPDSSDAAAPGILLLILRLMQSGASWTDALDTPLHRALWLSVLAAEWDDRQPRFQSQAIDELERLADHEMGIPSPRN
jgi:hypothetical protein